MQEQEYIEIMKAERRDEASSLVLRLMIYASLAPTPSPLMLHGLQRLVTLIEQGL
jgi:hypothetical protein